MRIVLLGNGKYEIQRSGSHYRCRHWSSIDGRQYGSLEQAQAKKLQIEESTQRDALARKVVQVWE